MMQNQDRRRVVVLRLHRRLLPLLTVGYALLFMDRTNISFAKLAMGTELSLSDETFGLASGTLFLTYSLMQVPSTQLSAGRLGSRRVLAATLVCSGLSSAAMSLVSSATGLVWLRALLGVCEAGYFPSTIFYLSQWYPDAAAGEAVAIFMNVAWTAAQLFGSSSACVVDALDGTFGIAQWRWLFALQGAATVLCGTAVLQALPDSPRDVDWLTDAEQMHLGSGGPAAASAGLCPRSTLTSVFDVVKRPSTWLLGLLWFTASVMQFAAVFFLPLLVHEMLPQLSLCATMLLVGSVGCFTVALGPLASAWADRDSPKERAPQRGALGTTSRRFKLVFGVVTFCGATLLLIGTALLAVAPQPPASWLQTVVSRFAVGAFALQYVASGSLSGSFWAMHHATTPSKLHALSIPTINSVGLLGGFVGPYSLGMLHDRLAPRCAPPLPATSALHKGPQPSGEASASERHCISEWGWGCAVLGLAALVLVSLNLVANRLAGVGRRGGSAMGGGATHSSTSNSPNGSGSSSHRSGGSRRGREEHDRVELKGATDH